jgi:DNA gyrase subunit A
MTEPETTAPETPAPPPGPPPPTTPTQILPTSIEQEMKTSFIDYAMSVIIARALPNVRDGLKPVHRRILYAMHQLKNFHNQPYKKSARIVGDVIGRFHPHGDQAVYEALVRMAQDFSLRYPLADGQGNFGSVDGDPAAAMRYTEVRMARIGGEMLADIEMDTVGWQPNYDDKEVEPEILPTRVPNLLVNGAVGIAVGMATNIPPHNLREVIDATIALVRNPKITLAELMEIIPGPDFPTAGFICGRQGIVQAYQTGRGQIVMRARTLLEDGQRGKRSIIVTELPYQVNKARLLEKMAELVKEKRVEGISDLRDESDRDGIRVVIELKKDAVPEVLLNQLYKLTPLQETFGINVLAIVDGRPETLALRDLLWKFVEHRKDVVTRRSAFELREAQKRAHILEGLKIALDHLDEVIALIRRAESPAAARTGLVASFQLSEDQAQAILDMRLQRLTGLEREKILAELAEVQARIAYLQELLADREKLLGVVVTEMEEIREAYGDDRRTEIVDAVSDISAEDMIAEEDMVVTVTHSGYIKRNPISSYRAQKRGGKGVTGMAPRPEDFVSDLFIASTHAHILFFTNTGRVYCRKVYEIPEGGRASRGKAIVNLIELKGGESVHEMLAVPVFEEGKYVMMATRRGLVKKTGLMEFGNIRSTGIIGIELEEGDQLIDVRLTDGYQDLLLSTRRGMAIRFSEEQVRKMGRATRGVRGIGLRDGDEVVGMETLAADSASQVVTVCEHGYGKRTVAMLFGAQRRGGKGLIAIKASERNGQVVGSRVVTDEHDIMLITDVGKVIRMPVTGISVIGRNTQGVRLIRLDEGEHVVGVEILAEKEDESAGPPVTAEAPTPEDLEGAEEPAPDEEPVEDEPVEDEPGAEEPDRTPQDE